MMEPYVFPYTVGGVAEAERKAEGAAEKEV